MSLAFRISLAISVGPTSYLYFSLVVFLPSCALEFLPPSRLLGRGFTGASLESLRSAAAPDFPDDDDDPVHHYTLFISVISSHHFPCHFLLLPSLLLPAVFWKIAPEL